jgi:serine/threonine protein kinase
MSADQYATIDRLLDQFADAFRDGEFPRIEAYLPRVSPQGRESLLEELLLMELELRRAAQEVPDEQEYLRRFPAEAELVARAFTQSLAMTQSPVPAVEPERPALESQGAGSRVLRTVSLPEFTRQVTELEAISEEAWQALRGTTGDSARSLARALVEAGVLTRFQAELLLRGEGSRLRVGNYLLEEPLGAGGMGQVYRGRHLRLKRPVAIKVLSADLSENRQAIKRFEREVRLASKVSHPNVVTALDAEEHDGRWYLVMEYVPGQDLSKWVRARGPAPVAEAVDWICQAAQGLESAHEQGILHRDIKPGNLLLTDAGQIKVLDLGLAISNSQGSTAANLGRTVTQLTSTGMALGTVDFMSPEQAGDARVVDERSDLYSLGCTLYFLLVGEPPYGGGSIIERIVAHSSQAIPSLREARDDIPEALDRVVTRLLAKLPEQRYGSCGELLQDLRRLQAVGLPRQVPGAVRRPSRPRMATPVPSAAEQNPPEWAQLAVDSTPVVAGRAQSSADGELWGQRRWLAGLLGAMALVAAVGGLGWSARGGSPAAKLNVTVKPEDAVVELVNPQGQVVAREAARGGQATLQAPPGGYRLKVSLDEFDRAERDVVLLGNESKSVEVVLEPSPRRMARQAANNKPVDGTLWFHTPEFEKWDREVRMQPAQKQLLLLEEKVLELNWDRKELNPQVEKGMGRRPHDAPIPSLITFRAEFVRDLSPLRLLKDNPALAKIQGLQFDLEHGRSKAILEDLSPLEGLKLRSLSVDGSPIKSLAPLEMMPLEFLDISRTTVTDLSPLQLCPQLKVLWLKNKEFQTLAPLQNLKLEGLDLGACAFDADELRWVESLKELSLAKCRGITNLRVLWNVPLVRLDISGTSLTDLNDVPVEHLVHLVINNIDPANVDRLKEAQKLVSLSANMIPIDKLLILQDLPDLQSLTIAMNKEDQPAVFAKLRPFKSLRLVNNQPFPEK